MSYFEQTLKKVRFSLSVEGPQQSYKNLISPPVGGHLKGGGTFNFRGVSIKKFTPKVLWNSLFVKFGQEVSSINKDHWTLVRLNTCTMRIKRRNKMQLISFEFKFSITNRLIFKAFAFESNLYVIMDSLEQSLVNWFRKRAEKSN